MARIEAIKPGKYVRKAFEEEAPSKGKLQGKLEAEAKKAISSWMFWTLKDKRQEYVNSRLEPLYQQELPPTINGSPNMKRPKIRPKKRIICSAKDNAKSVSNNCLHLSKEGIQLSSKRSWQGFLRP